MSSTIVVDFALKGVDAVNRSIVSIGKAAERASVQRVRTEQKAAQATERAAAKAAQATEREAKKATAAAVKAKQKEVQDVLKLGEKAVDMVRRGEEAKRREYERTAQLASREAARMARAQERAAAQTKAAFRKNLSDFGGAATRGVSRPLRAVAGTAAALATGGAVAGIYSGTRSALDLQRREALLQNNTGLTGMAGKGFAAYSRDVSNQTGVDAGSILKGVENIAEKAGSSGLVRVQNEFAQLAKDAVGAGVSIEDLGSVLGTMVNRGLDGKELRAVMAGLIEQGRDGAVEFKDLATMLDASSGALIKFKMSSKDRTVGAGGLTQLARTFGKKSPEEATNAVVDLARDLGDKADKIKELSGIEVGVAGTNRAQLRDPTELLAEIISKMAEKGNLGKLEGAGNIFTGNATSITTPLAQAAQLGVTKNKDGRYEITKDGEKADLKGKGAIEAMMKQFLRADADIKKQEDGFKNLAQTDAFKLSQAFEQMQNQIATALLPAIAKAAPQVQKFAEKFAEKLPTIINSIDKLVSYVEANPLKSLGIVLGASVGKEVGGVLISKLAEKAFNAVTGMVVNAGTVTVSSATPGGAPGGAGGKVGGALAVAGAGLAGYAAGAAITGEAEAMAKKADKERQGSALSAQNLAIRIRGGNASPEDIAQAKKLLADNEGKTGPGMDSYFANFRRIVHEGSAGLLKGEFTGENVKKLTGFGAGEAMDAANDTNLKASLDELKMALTRPTDLAPGSTVMIGNIEELRAAINPSPAGGKGPINGMLDRCLPPERACT